MKRSTHQKHETLIYHFPKKNKFRELPLNFEDCLLLMWRNRQNGLSFSSDSTSIRPIGNRSPALTDFVTAFFLSAHFLPLAPFLNFATSIFWVCFGGTLQGFFLLSVKIRHVGFWILKWGCLLTVYQHHRPPIFVRSKMLIVGFLFLFSFFLSGSNVQHRSERE